MYLKWIHHLFSTKTEHKWRTYSKFVCHISTRYIVKICHSVFGNRNLLKRHFLCNHIPNCPDTSQVGRYVLPNVDCRSLQYILWIYWRQNLKMSFIHSFCGEQIVDFFLIHPEHLWDFYRRRELKNIQFLSEGLTEIIFKMNSHYISIISSAFMGQCPQCKWMSLVVSRV